ncbi:MULTISPECIES: hypothetical protein [Cyanophyceae]|uniref:hypothetical protein n=1 Tax=Cyanophyceae TaxID=3028117 RepID=UPI0016884E0C|nr:hypothetical protein [Trichocoleus sp. FACHB-40]MBD2001909.1 hypothetical protein [Trichocoleus sp. FACHB-40]
MNKPDYESMSDWELLAHLSYCYQVQANDEGRKLIREAVEPEIFELITHPDVQKTAEQYSQSKHQ